MAPHAVAIVGCGIAGQAAALLFHRAGHRVELFERFAAPRPIGAGLLIQPTGLAVLERLGLAESALAHGEKVTRLLGHNRRGRVVLDVDYRHFRRDSFGLGLQRATLFGLLHAAVRDAGIPVTTGTAIADIETAGPLRLLDGAGRRHGPFDGVIVCDGADSALRARLARVRRAPRYPYGALWTVAGARGAPTEVLRQVYDGPRRMAGILPIGRRPGDPPDTRQVALFWSLRHDHHPAWQAAGLDGWRRELDAYWPEFAGHLDGISADSVVFGHYRDVILRSPIAGRVLFIGDAAHGTSPQLGQGANLALVDAAVLADCLARAGTLDAAYAAYAKARRAHLWLYQWASRYLTPLFQSERDRLGTLRDTLLGPVGRLPYARSKAASLMAGMCGGLFRHIDLDELRGVSKGTGGRGDGK